MKLLAVPVVLFLTVFVAGQSQPKSTEPPASTPSRHADDKETPAPTKIVVSRLRVSSGVARGLLLKKVEPSYPQEAKDAHIQGTVILHAIIDKDGNITGLKWISGPKELLSSATEAVQQWKYRPYLLQGKPIELDTIIEIKYSLEH